jgi:hypothetical protein
LAGRWHVFFFPDAFARISIRFCVILIIKVARLA